MGLGGGGGSGRRGGKEPVCKGSEYLFVVKDGMVGGQWGKGLQGGQVSVSKEVASMFGFRARMGVVVGVVSLPPVAVGVRVGLMEGL